MAETKIEVPPFPVLTLENRDQMKVFEEEHDCFILEFDPFDEIDISKLSLSEDYDNDLCVLAEKGKVACRDYPHPRHECAKYPFHTTPHDTHCDLCYCYVCDSSAPCEKWVGYSGHCHAFDNQTWRNHKEARRSLLKTM